MSLAWRPHHKELLRAVAKQHNLHAHSLFARNLQQIWRKAGIPPLIGLAISGGVDSMALARLCHDVMKADTGVMKPLLDIGGFRKPDTEFTAFIVNHRLRENSRMEAENVAAELARLEINSEILELDWNPFGDPKSLPNLESVARKLRYQALGIACAKNGINSLLLAHHSDDQAETVLTRIAGGYVGSGLAGMARSVPIPECTGLYGVSRWGRRRRPATVLADLEPDPNPLVDGGVHVARPLIALRKGQLMKLCRRSGTKWFEDPTNYDVKYTVRNTIRALQTSDVLPVALQSPRLLMLARRAAAKRGETKGTVRNMIENLPIEMNLKLGEAKFTLEPESGDTIWSTPAIRSSFVRNCLELVSPKFFISTQRIDAAVDYIFGPDAHNSVSTGEGEPKAIQVAGVSIQREFNTGYRAPTTFFLKLHRAVPSKRERMVQQLTMWTTPVNLAHFGATWQLWDGRYWIRVFCPKALFDPVTKVIARFLDQEDLAVLRKQVTKAERERLDIALASAKGLARFTLPAIVVQRTSSSTTSEGESTMGEVVALPSLNWSIDGWPREGRTDFDDTWRWDIRYKHVDLENGALHKIVPC